MSKKIPSPEQIRIARLENPAIYQRDLAENLGISEAELIAAHIGHGVTRIKSDPDLVIDHALKLGEVMALTRNQSCVLERVGQYNNYSSGPRAAMVLDKEIDLRIFPKFWVTAFAVEKQTNKGISRSIQIFSETGMAVHKIHLRDTSNMDHWQPMIDELRHHDQTDSLTVIASKAPDPPKADPDKLEKLRARWDAMTDTHQFFGLMAKLKMNRLGAYRIVGAPYVRLVANSATEQALLKISEDDIKVMIFVGNHGCIQIHGGFIDKLKSTRAWINVIDKRFNLHLRRDDLAESYIVTKPTKRGPAISLEAFDSEGQIILQIFADSSDGKDNITKWTELLSSFTTITTDKLADATT